MKMKNMQKNMIMSHCHVHFLRTNFTKCKINAAKKILILICEIDHTLPIKFIGIFFIS